MATDQQFCLRWNNFQNSLLTTLPQLLDADDLTDVTICAGGKSVKAHRVVLSACSHYFKELFKEIQPFHHPVIVLPTTKYADICALVSFMYSGEVNVYQEQLPSLLAAAAALHIRGLAEVPPATAGKISPPETPTSSKDDPPPSKRSKIVTSTPNTMPSPPSPVSSEPQNLATSLKQSPEMNEILSSRLDRSLDNLTLPKLETTGDTGIHTNDSSPPHDTSDLLAMHTNDSTAYGHSTSEDSHSSDPEINEKLLQAVSQGLSPSLPHPLNFLPSSSMFTPFTSLARNKLFATCHICGKSLSNQYNLRVHLETHQNLNYSCTLCSHVSRSRDALRKHIAYKHTEGKFVQRKLHNNSSSTNSSPEDSKLGAAEKFNNNSQQASC